MKEEMHAELTKEKALEAKAESAKRRTKIFAVLTFVATIFLAASTAVSMAPVSENVKRVGQKVKTGKGRKY